MPAPYRVTIAAIGDVVVNARSFTIAIAINVITIYTFDNDGRLLSVFREGKHYKRGFDNRMMMKYYVNDKKQRVWLTPDEAIMLITATLDDIAAIRSSLLPATQHASSAAAARFIVWLDTILAWDILRYQQDSATFAALYTPLGILPPDQYLALVLQATEGCTWNKCTFCTLYHHQPFRMKQVDEFRMHAKQVRAFFGGSAGTRQTLFLADANALMIPQARLCSLLHIAHETFPIGAPRNGFDYVLDGVYGFLDIFGAEKKSVRDYRELRDAAVRRIYIGLETGDPMLFSMLNKLGSPHECVDVVKMIKSSGINVGVMVLAGVGGTRWHAQHVRQTVDTLARMSLERGDIVYVSPLLVGDDAAYSVQMRQHGIKPLSYAATMQQVSQLKTILKATLKGKPRIALYHVEEFLY